MSKVKQVKQVKKDNTVDGVIETQEVSTAQSIVVTALDPVYNDRGQLSYGFTIALDTVTYSFRIDQQGYLQFNNSGSFFKQLKLHE